MALSGRLRLVCASPCGFVRGGCARCASVLAVLFGAFALDVRPFLRFCRGSGLRLARVRPYGFVAAFGLGSRLSFFLCQEKRDGLRDVAFLFRRGSRSPIVRSRGVGAVICLGGFISGLYVSLWRSRRVTETWGTELRGGRGWRRGACASLRNRIGLAMLSAGSTLGLRAPNLRQRVFDSLDSPHAAAGLRWCGFAAPSSGHYRRPDRL